MKNFEIYILKSNYQSNFYIYQVGHEKCTPFHSFGPVIRDFSVLHFIKQGQGVLEVNGKAFNLKKDDLFLVPPGKTVRYYANKDNPYDYYWIGFTGLFDKEYLKIIGFEEDNYVINEKEHASEILTLFENISKITNERSIKDNLFAKSLFFSLMSLLTPENAEYKLIDEKQDLILKIISYIDQNYATTSIKEISENYHVHRSTIYRLFIRNYKMSPNEYLLNYKLERALFFLKNTESSIKKIAITTGFEDSESFCKAFKNKFSKTPSEARKLK